VRSQRLGRERIRSVLKELAPDLTDVVVKGFAVEPDDLKRVATPELLDDIASKPSRSGWAIWTSSTS